ncbi:MAG TPA: ankyrin repeat domain-containing protein [Candidatus Dependentiae bacterium]|nr:ankyrin repeat domain-containing protein [Candidatus Dependentiae bacterium]
MNKLVKKTLNAIVLVSSLCSVAAYSMNIFEASHTGKVEKIRELIATGINVNVQDEKGYTPLTLAISSERIRYEDMHEIVRILLNAGANPNLPDNSGHTPLNEAVYRRLHTIVDLIIHIQARVQMTALLGAAVHERLGSDSPAQLLYDQYLAREIGTFVLEAAKETALRR